MTSLLTIPQAAERLGYSEYTVRKMCRTGELDARKVRNSQWRIPDTAIAQFYESTPKGH